MKVCRKPTLPKPVKWLLLLGLLLLLTLCLSGCLATISSCPPYPVAGDGVAGELRQACLAEGKNLCPDTFAWLDRIGKLKDQLALCGDK